MKTTNDFSFQQQPSSRRAFFLLQTRKDLENFNCVDLRNELSFVDVVLSCFSCNYNRILRRIGYLTFSRTTWSNTIHCRSFAHVAKHHKTSFRHSCMSQFWFAFRMKLYSEKSTRNVRIVVAQSAVKSGANLCSQKISWQANWKIIEKLFPLDWRCGGFGVWVMIMWKKNLFGSSLWSTRESKLRKNPRSLIYQTSFSWDYLQLICWVFWQQRQLRCAE